MAHKTLIGGTAYEISGGKTLINGTAYEISGGKTLVNGTAYGIGFVPTIIFNPYNMGSGNLQTVYCVVDGITYDVMETAKGTKIKVPEGTEIYCYVKKPALNNTPATISVNGTVVAQTDSTQFVESDTSYNYIVTGDATIDMTFTLNTAKIEITEG